MSSFRSFLGFVAGNVLGAGIAASLFSSPSSNVSSSPLCKDHLERIAELERLLSQPTTPSFLSREISSVSLLEENLMHVTKERDALKQQLDDYFIPERPTFKYQAIYAEADTFFSAAVFPDAFDFYQFVDRAQQQAQLINAPVTKEKAGSVKEVILETNTEGNPLAKIKLMRYTRNTGGFIELTIPDEDYANPDLDRLQRSLVLAFNTDLKDPSHYDLEFRLQAVRLPGWMPHAHRATYLDWSPTDKKYNYESRIGFIIPGKFSSTGGNIPGFKEYLPTFEQAHPQSTLPLFAEQIVSLFNSVLPPQ